VAIKNDSFTMNVKERFEQACSLWMFLRGIENCSERELNGKRAKEKEGYIERRAKEKEGFIERENDSKVEMMKKHSRERRGER
jgi:hypothetical protein